MSDELRKPTERYSIFDRATLLFNNAGECFRAPKRATYIVLAIALALSIGCFAYFFNNGMTNVYGDGVARVNIARKVVDHPEDSFWQRYVQIGSPWLPLPTVAMLPLVANDWMWRTGFAGSILSMASFVIAALALFLHARHLYRKEADQSKALFPFITAAIFLFNPAALYMQSTPMTESLFMCALALSAYLLRRWVVTQSRRRLVVAAVVMMMATLTRYEAWPVAGAAILIVLLASRGTLGLKFKSAALFSIVTMTGPIYWLWHNWIIYDDALWFLTGPYSARGLYLQHQANLGWSKIFVGHALLDVFLMLVTVAACVGPVVMLVAAAGLARLIVTRRRAIIEDSPALLLIIPFFFHLFSLYRGEIQIFPLSAFGLLNVRYGLPHLVAAALFAPASIPLMSRLGRRGAIAVFCLAVTAQYAYLISDGPSQLAVYQEGYRNGVNARAARERARVSSLVKNDPPRPLILMHTGALGPIVSQGGLRYSNIIHEGTASWHRINQGIPREIFTVIFEEGDPLDQRLREHAALAGDLKNDFQQKLEVGKIRVFRRIENGR